MLHGVELDEAQALFFIPDKSVDFPSEMYPGSVILDLSCVVELTLFTTSFCTSRGRWNHIGHY